MKYLKILISIHLIIQTIGCYSKDPEKTGLEGEVLPQFNLLLSDSTIYTHTKGSTSNRPEVVFYYSPRCPYCRSQITEIIQNMDKLIDVQFYLTTHYSFSEMKKFEKEYMINKYTNIIHGIDIENRLGDYYRIEHVPFTAIYGIDNKLKSVFVGSINGKLIKKAVFN